MPRFSTALGSCAIAAWLAVAAAGCAGSGSDGVGAAPDVADEPPITIPLERVAGVGTVAEYTQLLYAGELDTLYDLFSDEFREGFARDDLQSLYDLMLERFGREVSLVSMQRKQSGEYRAFARFAIFDRYDGVVQLLWILRDDDRIAGLSLEASPKKPSAPGAP